MKRKIATILGAALLTATPASAVIYVTTYTGYATSGTDGRGALSDAPISLAGKAVIITYRLDTTKIINMWQPFAGITLLESDRGGMVTSIDVNGKRSNFSNYWGLTRWVDAGSGTQGYDQIVSQTLMSSNDQVYTNVNSRLNDILYTNNFPDHVTYVVDPINDYTNLYVITHDLKIQGGIDRFTISSSVVPEPASWAMMVVGFGMVGAGLRRNARSRVIA